LKADPEANLLKAQKSSLLFDAPSYESSRAVLRDQVRLFPAESGDPVVDRSQPEKTTVDNRTSRIC